MEECACVCVCVCVDICVSYSWLKVSEYLIDDGMPPLQPGSKVGEFKVVV